MKHSDTYDYVIIGSGFGGSVSAMRLAEKGYSVLVLERGKRFADEDLPKTNWDIRKYLWMPTLRCFGILQMSLSRGYFVYHSSGVGGGSLVYAATLMEPNEDFFSADAWRDLDDWKSTLQPHYETAKRMLGVAPNPRMWPADEALQSVAEDLGYGDTFRPTEVGIFFGEPGVNVSDPYFGGEGPNRSGCTHCGACIVGCRENAKNDLTKNYLYFAEKLGVEILPEVQADKIHPLHDEQPDDARYVVHYHSSTGFFRKTRASARARNVILSAGVLGTLSLLLYCKEELGSLKNLSPHLGDLVRTNSEAFMGAYSQREIEDHSQGLTITSIDEKTQIEPVRFQDGSSLLYRLLSSPIIDPSDSFLQRLWSTIIEIFKFPRDFINVKFIPGLTRRGIAMMLMQTEDNLMRLRRGRNPFTLYRPGLIGEHDAKRTIPVNINLGNRVARLFAEKIKAHPSGAITSLLNVPMTAHILGGCVISKTPDEGVIDMDCQVHNYPGLYVVDGSIVPANPGVNPSLTITALAEYAMSRVPPKNGQTLQPPSGVHHTVEAAPHNS
jgi:cholesterol oxidase